MSDNRWGRFTDSPVSTVTTERIALELGKVGVTLSTTAHHSVDHDMVGGELAHRLTAYVMRDHLIGDTYTSTIVREVTLTAQVPASWWQHLKLTHLPTVARWRPVRLARLDVDGIKSFDVTTVFDRYATYPGANIALPSDRLGAPVIFETARMS